MRQARCPRRWVVEERSLIQILHSTNVKARALVGLSQVSFDLGGVGILVIPQRRYGRIPTRIVREHVLERRIWLTEARDGLERLRVRCGDSPEELAPRENDRHAIGDTPNLPRELSRVRCDAQKIANASAGLATGSAPRGPAQRIIIQIHGDEEP